MCATKVRVFKCIQYIEVSAGNRCQLIAIAAVAVLDCGTDRDASDTCTPPIVNSLVEGYFSPSKERILSDAVLAISAIVLHSTNRELYAEEGE